MEFTVAVIVALGVLLLQPTALEAFPRFKPIAGQFDHPRAQQINHLRAQQFDHPRVQQEEQFDHPHVQQFDHPRVQQEEQFDHPRVQQFDHLRAEQFDHLRAQQFDHPHVQQFDHPRVQQEEQFDHPRVQQVEQFDHPRVQSNELATTQAISIVNCGTAGAIVDTILQATLGTLFPNADIDIAIDCGGTCTEVTVQAPVGTTQADVDVCVNPGNTSLFKFSKCIPFT